ncbi:MAG: ATP-binding cassette domain-containing protein [Bacteroidetes bacterium]|nr:ATP-binding cassette domain-containing protein [Bacteroidota bacterium]
MSDKIVKALMQLFAILANTEQDARNGRAVVHSFLNQQINPSLVDFYLNFFDEYLSFLQGKADPDKQKKRVSVNSVKVLRICSDINAELNIRQKYIVLLRLFEFAYSSGKEINNDEQEFLDTVVSSFNIELADATRCLLFIKSSADNILSSDAAVLLCTAKNDNQLSLPQMMRETLTGKILILFIKTANLYIVRNLGNNTLTLNGLLLVDQNAHVFAQGAVIRGPRMQPIYFNEVEHALNYNQNRSELFYQVSSITYKFRSGKVGLHSLSFEARSGNLIGIMGGSGAGKSTLLNILNSNHTPTSGSVCINGINIHSNKQALEGLIGYVPQDDLLIEELSVEQNLFYNAKLCFGNLDNIALLQKVYNTLGALGLMEVKNLKVGSPLDKTISGGQRKRLNIALELVREPAVLFVDEPTSGLSSRDSETVMDLLKQITASGKLVFVVIHQPSSNIFKLFDSLLLLDNGGYPIYYGNPSDAVLHFKQNANFADASVSECDACGNINAEQLFEIAEAKVVDEFGNQLNQRKVSPKQWNEIYLQLNGNFLNTHTKPSGTLPPVETKKPSALKQFTIYLKRDLVSKLNNRQYLLITLGIAPALAFILSFFLKNYHTTGQYSFYKNINLPAFIFMGVIVHLFTGLMLSAEEIFRDRKIIKREAFLHLSKDSYLLAKIVLLAGISAIQAALFVVISNFIFELRGMYFDYWLMYFTVSCFANMLGLNISKTFNSVVTIYILIPLLIIPQIILSGVIVKYENLHPAITCNDKVPMIGEIMASRWAFEGLAVHQFKNNQYNKLFFAYDAQLSNAYYLKDIWLPVIQDSVMSINKNFVSKNLKVPINYKCMLADEINSKEIALSGYNHRTYEISSDNLTLLQAKLEEFRKQKVNDYNLANAKKQALVEKQLGDNDITLNQLEQHYSNQSLSDMVLNNMELKRIKAADSKLIRLHQPVYMISEKGCFRAPFFVHQKYFLGHYYPTYLCNIVVIWLMTLFLYLSLRLDWFRSVVKVLAYWKQKAGFAKN